ncbi:acyl carrier protein [Paenibacillus sp. FSL H8-0537]|uniref:acyl carrier protein n=1 Tax=Paenibacillus sp. FSL H8-0537 TaxID=2921399 RepID=UPI003100D34A
MSTTTLKKEVQENILKVLAKLLKEDAENISLDADLFEEVGIDSTGIIELLLELEIYCSIEFDMEELDPSHLSSVNTLTDYIVFLKSDE